MVRVGQGVDVKGLAEILHQVNPKEFGALDNLHGGPVIVQLSVAVLFFPLKATLISFIRSTLGDRLLAPHQAVSCCISSLSTNTKLLVCLMMSLAKHFTMVSVSR